MKLQLEIVPSTSKRSSNDSRPMICKGPPASRDRRAEPIYLLPHIFQRPRRGIPNPHSSLITGFFIYCNFVRPHPSLNGCTPAEAAGIIIHGVDKLRSNMSNIYLAARAMEAGS